MKSEKTGVAGAQPTIGALPSAGVLERLGWERATAGLTARQVFYLQNVLSHYWQPGGTSLRESCRLATLVHRRVWRCATAPLRQWQVARRFARLDQGMLRSMRESLSRHGGGALSAAPGAGLPYSAGQKISERRADALLASARVAECGGTGRSR